MAGASSGARATRASCPNSNLGETKISKHTASRRQQLLMTTTWKQMSARRNLGNRDHRRAPSRNGTVTDVTTSLWIKRCIPNLEPRIGRRYEGPASSERVAQMFFCAKISPSQQQQSRQKRPEHQAHRKRERPVDFSEIQPRQCQEVAKLQRL